MTCRILCPVLGLPALINWTECRVCLPGCLGSGAPVLGVGVVTELGLFSLERRWLKGRTHLTAIPGHSNPDLPMIL